MNFDMDSAVAVNEGAQTIPTTSFDPETARAVDEKPKEKVSPVGSFLRNIFKNSPIEQMDTAAAQLNLYAGIQPNDSGEIKSKKIQDSMTRPSDVPEETVSQGMQDREKQIGAQGVMRQLEGPMMLAVGEGAVAAPAATALAVGAFTVADHFFNARRWIDENAPKTPPALEDLAEIFDMAAKGAAIGMAGVFGKSFILDRFDNLNLPKSVTLKPEQVKEIQNKTTITEPLGITSEHAKSAIASQTPVEVPVEKVIDLARTDNWEKAKEDLGLKPKAPEPPITMGFSDGKEPTATPSDTEIVQPGATVRNEFVKKPELKLFTKETSKTTADEIRARMVGAVDEQKTVVNQWAQTGKKQIPDGLEQQAMFWYAGASGNKAKIVDYMMKMEELPKGDPIKEYYEKELKPQMQKALDLSPKAIEKLKQGSKYYQEAGQVAKEMGTIKTIRENYQSARIYKPEPPEDVVAAGKRRVGTTTKHSKERFYETPFDAVLGGKEFATTNYFDALTVHNEELAYVNTSRAMLDEMAGLELGKWVERENIPAGYKQVGDLRKGQEVFASPELISKGLTAITDPNNLRKIQELTAIGKLNGFVKSFNVALSFFHHHQFVKQTLSSKNGEKILAGFIKDIATRKDPFETEDFKLMEQQGAKDGLRTSIQQANFDIMADINKVEGKWLDKIKKVPGIKQVEKLVDANNKFLFDTMQRYFKVMVYGDRVAEWVGKHPEATEQEAVEARRGVARAVNNTYGGQNWEMLGIDKTRTAMLRLALFAPDWLMSAILHTKDAAIDYKTPAGKIARANLVKGLLLGTAWTQLLNHLATGHFTDENKKGHKMEAQIAPNVYMNLFGGATGEFVKFSSNVLEDNGLPGAIRYFQGKSAPLVRFAMMIQSGKNYQGQSIETVPFKVKKGDDIMMHNVNYILNLASSITPLPFSFQSKIGTPENEDKTLLGEAATFSGIGRYSKPAKKKKSKRYSISEE